MCREHSPKCARKAENNMILQDHPEPIYLPCKVETIHTNVLDAKSYLDYRNLFLTLSEQSYLRQDCKFLKSITRWIKFRALIFIYIKQELNFSTRICEKKNH